MTDDPTTDLTADEKLNRILAELSDMKAGLSALEAAAEDRARETRPKLDLLIKEMADTRAEIREIAAAQARLEQKFDVLVDDSMVAKTFAQFCTESKVKLGSERRP